MEMKATATGVLYLLKDKFQIYSNHLPTILEFSFDPKAVHNFNVIDKEKLKVGIKEFIAQNKIPESNLIICISDHASFLCTAQDHESTTSEKNFQEQVPDQQIIIRTIHTTGHKTLYATNQEVYETIKAAFEQAGTSIEFILPGFVYPNNISTQPSLTLEMSSTIFQQTIPLKRYNLLNSQTAMDEQDHQADQAQKLFERERRKKDILHLYAYSSIFGVLIIALLVSMNINNVSQTYRGKADTNQSNIIMPSAQETKDLKVLIVDSSHSPRSVRQIRNMLTKYSFQSITIQANEPKEKTKDVIIFSDKTTPLVQAAVLTEIKKYLPEILVQNNAEAEFDITISIGNH